MYTRGVGRIVASVKINSVSNGSMGIRCDALVDTGSAFLVLPSAWRDRLGKLETGGKVKVETANQETVEGEICGPVRIEVEGFRPIYSEVLFLDTKPIDGTYEPLLGYIVLEQCQAAVDMLGYRLIPGKAIDAKQANAQV
ncbi:MAG: aspartyl protease family protein [Acidobacteriota bacterium]